MRKLIFTDLAQGDIQGIVYYYDEINPTLTDKFLNELEFEQSHIEKYPETCPKKTKNLRVCFLKRFRFGIYFKIFPEAVVVVAVLHTSRNPQIWKNR